MQPSRPNMIIIIILLIFFCDSHTVQRLSHAELQELFVDIKSHRPTTFECFYACARNKCACARKKLFIGIFPRMRKNNSNVVGRWRMMSTKSSCNSVKDFYGHHSWILYNRLFRLQHSWKFVHFWENLVFCQPVFCWFSESCWFFASLFLVFIHPSWKNWFLASLLLVFKIWEFWSSKVL